MKYIKTFFRLVSKSANAFVIQSLEDFKSTTYSNIVYFLTGMMIPSLIIISYIKYRNNQVRELPQKTKNIYFSYFGKD